MRTLKNMFNLRRAEGWEVEDPDKKKASLMNSKESRIGEINQKINQNQKISNFLKSDKEMKEKDTGECLRGE